MKTFKWMIAIRKINEKMAEEQEKATTMAEINANMGAGEKVIIKNGSIGR